MAVNVLAHSLQGGGTKKIKIATPGSTYKLVKNDGRISESSVTHTFHSECAGSVKVYFYIDNGLSSSSKTQSIGISATCGEAKVEETKEGYGGLTISTDKVLPVIPGEDIVIFMWSSASRPTCSASVEWDVTEIETTEAADADLIHE